MRGVPIQFEYKDKNLDVQAFKWAPITESGHMRAIPDGAIEDTNPGVPHFYFGVYLELWTYFMVSASTGSRTQGTDTTTIVTTSEGSRDSQSG